MTDQTRELMLERARVIASTLLTISDATGEAVTPDQVQRAPAGGRPTVRFRINPRLLAGRHERSRHVPPEAFRRS